jgi:hypothetical protein
MGKMFGDFLGKSHENSRHPQSKRAALVEAPKTPLDEEEEKESGLFSVNRFIFSLFFVQGLEDGG